MKKWLIGVIVVAVLIIAGLIWIALNIKSTGVPPLITPETCYVDEDCVPKQCCHPTECVNRDYALDCGKILCSMSCEGPLDCNAGRCGCVNHRCKVIPN